MLYEIENLDKLETLTLELKVGDILSIGEPRIKFILRDDSILADPMCKSSSVVEAMDRVTAYVSRYLKEKIENSVKQIEFDCMNACPIFPGRKRCRKRIEYTTDPETGHVWENIYTPCGHICHDQTAFYEQMKKTMANSKNVNFDACIELNPEVLHSNTAGIRQFNQNNPEYQGEKK